MLQVNWLRHSGMLHRSSVIGELERGHLHVRCSLFSQEAKVYYVIQLLFSFSLR